MLWAVLAVIVIATLYFYFSKKFAYFKNNGIAYEPGYFPFGSSNSWKMMTGKGSFVALTDEVYVNHPKEKWVGYYGTLGTPVLLIRDIELGKKILIKDFDYFADRRALSMDKDVNKYFANMLTTLTGMECITSSVEGLILKGGIVLFGGKMISFRTEYGLYVVARGLNFLWYIVHILT